MQSFSLIIVDDETDLSELIADYLGRHGFSVRAASSGAELDACLAQQPADLIVLDVNMPGEDGFSIARRIRTDSAVPILMLTSASGIADRVMALDHGVDDYLMKPFDLRELRARVASILRRSTILRPVQVKVRQVSHNQVQFGTLVLDMDSHCLFRSDGTELPLTAMEYDLLRVFAANPNRALSRGRLLDIAHRNDHDPFDRSIDIRVTRLRRKIEADPGKPSVIRTVRGTGYMYVPTRQVGLHA